MRNIPGWKDFQRLMWEEMSRDPEWSDSMDKGVAALPPGESWPMEDNRS